MASVERARVQRWCDLVETELRDVGGLELVVDARREAESYAALYFVWDGRGEEPLDRLRARVGILSTRLQSARETEHRGSAPPGPAELPVDARPVRPARCRTGFPHGGHGRFGPGPFRGSGRFSIRT